VSGQEPDFYTTRTVGPGSRFANGELKYYFEGRKLLGKVVAVSRHRDEYHRVLVIEQPKVAGGPPCPLPTLPEGIAAGLRYPWS
jgi:hypothetical protein